ncbi:MAG: ABC transporter permease subunit [Proteobacteria bacterium]|nr:ABC transporter permease subunit [Pseudomonadota bacterium]
MIRVIARNEWRRLFAQPLAWALLAAVLAVLAYFFLLALQGFLGLSAKLAGMASAPGATDLVALPLLRAIASVLLLVVPLLGMRALAGERQSGTLAVLQSSGAGSTRIVLGKFAALCGFFIVLIALALAMPASLAIGTHPDWGRLGAGAFGLLWFAAALTGIAIAASSYTRQPVVAAGLALALNLVLWMLDAGARHEGVSSAFINYLALPTHLEPFLHGIVASVDIVYFVLIAALALTLAVRRLNAERVRG